jgi:methionyl-tRNA synthetase
MDEWYTAGLVNGLGNLTARIMKMAETHLDKPIEPPTVASSPSEYTNALERYDFMAACDYVWRQVQTLDERITETEPFKLVKEDKLAAAVIIKELVCDLHLIAELLTPIMPTTEKIILKAVQENKKPENLFVRLPE